MAMPTRDELLEEAKRRLRAAVRKRPLLHRAAKEALVGYKLLRRRLRQRNDEPLHDWGRRIRTFAIPFAGRNLVDLQATLEQLGLVVAEGRHTLYLPPQPGREALLGSEFLAAYPPEAGIKLLKNFQPPQQAGYHHQTDARAEAALHGKVGTQVFAAAGLYANGLGPRPHDLVHLRGAHADLGAIVCEHVEGRTPTLQEYEAFMADLLALEARGVFGFSTPSRHHNNDFEAPKCNGNLITGPAGPRYVDSQCFLFEDKVVADLLGRHASALHFGDVLSVVNAGERFLYQEVPGLRGPARRGTQERWQSIEGLLSRHGLGLRERVIFDICCNSGMMMHGSLARGADWACGWDLPAVAEAADMLLPLLGSGRSTFFPRQLDESTNFLADLPEWIVARTREPHRPGIALFLAAWHHIGFPPGIGELPWAALIYEGRENEASSQTNANVQAMSERWRAREVERLIIRDGISGPRPLVLMQRT